MIVPVELVIVPRNKVGDHLLSRSRGPSYRTLISIGDPGARYPTGYGRVAQRLRLEMEDVAHPAAAHAPQLEHVRALIGFAPTVARLGGACLVHCEAGISRSTAAALIVLRTLLPGAAPAELVDWLRERVPHAEPNRLMIRYADEVLGEVGGLYEALAAAGLP